MAPEADAVRRRRPHPPSPTGRRRRRAGSSLLRGSLAAVLLLSLAAFAAETFANAAEEGHEINYGNRNREWEDGPSSWEEFGHGNEEEACGLAVLSAEEWELGRHWERNRPVLVTNVTEGWAALRHWRLREMLRRYPDVEATMGDGREVADAGPDHAGALLTPTTVKKFITKHMYDPSKYFFDRKIAIPKGMLEDCHPFPMPTRAYLEEPDAGSIYAPSKKLRVNPRPESELWRDHLAVSIGADLTGLSFHYHGEAWNVVLFGAKRWILYDLAEWAGNATRQRYLRLERRPESSADWLRQLYSEPERKREIRKYGHDCVQRAGEMMFVPQNWMPMVVNIGDTVSVISEVGLDRGGGRVPEDFSYDPGNAGKR